MPRGTPWRRLLTAAFAALAIFAYWTHAAERGVREAAPSAGATVRTTAGTTTGTTADTRVARDGTVFGAGVGFADTRRLEEHFEKHGAEFGATSRQDYLRMAQKLRDAPPRGSARRPARRDGVVTRFDRQTDGERYWRRQAERDP